MRSLRIGVVLGGQLVEERVFTGDVTIGQSLACDLSLPVDGVPRRHVLVRDGVLQPIGRVTGDLARGKIVIGEATILIQTVDRVIAPPVKLPASLRARGWDRRVMTIVGASLAVHGVIGYLAWNEDVSTAVLGSRDVPQSFQQETIDVSLPDFVERVDVPAAKDQGVAMPVTPAHHIVEQPRTSPSDPQRLAEEASRMASLLVGDQGDHGFGGMAHRAPGADLAMQMDEAQHRAVTIGEDGQHTSRVDDRARIGTSLNGGAPTMPDQVTTTPHRDEPPPGRIQIQPLPGDPGTTLTPQQVLDKIQTSYLAGLQRCYRLGQNEDATLEGKINIELTVDPHGRVTDPSATGLSPKVDSCVAGVMAGWHFGIPRDRDGEATDATFRIALVLKRG